MVKLRFTTLLILGDALVADRWRWLKTRLPSTRNEEKLLDVGCGSGAFTIGAALRGYDSHGMSWDEANQAKATARAKSLCAEQASFEVGDARELDKLQAFIGEYDVVLCLETIEHILDDKKLIQDIAACLKPGGRLLLTTPNYLYTPIAEEGLGPWSDIENGYHVRRGYTKCMLRELMDKNGLLTEDISYCSGFWSQKLTWLWRRLQFLGPRPAFILVLPLRPLALILDSLTLSKLWWPGFSICVVAQKPRF